MIEELKNHLLAELSDGREQSGIDLAERMGSRGYSWLARGKSYEALRQLQDSYYVTSRLSEPVPHAELRCRLYRIVPMHEVTFGYDSVIDRSLVPGVIGAALRRATERGCMVTASHCDGATAEDLPHYAVYGDVRGLVPLLKAAGFDRRFPDAPPRDHQPWWAFWKARRPIEADDWWYRCDAEAWSP